MQTTMMRYGTRQPKRAGNHSGYPDDTALFLKRFAPRGRDPAQADENLYRYCGNGPTDGTDPSGMAEPIEAIPGPVAAGGGDPFMISNDSAQGFGSTGSNGNGVVFYARHGYGMYDYTTIRPEPTAVVRVMRFMSGQEYSSLDSWVSGTPFSDLGKLAISDSGDRHDARTGLHFLGELGHPGGEATFFIVFEVSGCTSKLSISLDESDSTTTYVTKSGESRTFKKGDKYEDILHDNRHDTKTTTYSDIAHVPLTSKHSKLIVFFDAAHVWKMEESVGMQMSQTVKQVFTVKDGTTPIYTYTNSAAIDVHGQGTLPASDTPPTLDK